jgi:hypothetical protein
MSLRSTLQNASFDADDLKLMGCALDQAKAHLAASPPLIVQECMADRIIEAVHGGERDVKQLSDAALKGLVGAYE